MCQIRLGLSSILLGLALFLPGATLSAPVAPLPAAVPSPLHAPAGSSPLLFIENAGRWAGAARFQLGGALPATVWLAPDAIWLTVLEPSPSGDTTPLSGRSPDRFAPPGQPRRGANVRLSFTGANPAPVLEPFDRLDTVVSYFLGNDPDRWRPAVPVWSGVRYRDLYAGVDLELTGEGGQLEVRLVAEAGAALDSVALLVEGAEEVTFAGDALRLTTAVGGIIWPLPTAEGPDVQVVVEARSAQVFQVTTLYSSDPSADSLDHKASAISQASSTDDGPDDLIYGSFLGGSHNDYGYSIVADAAGAAYIGGTTNSPDFPTTPGAFDATHNGNYDVFVAKLNADRSSLVYATYIGGGPPDYGRALAVDGSGAAYLAGTTVSENFPTTPGAFDPSFNGIYDAFAVKLNPEGSGLDYGTFLGGSLFDWGRSIAVDDGGAAYVVGDTESTDFPSTPGAFDPTHNGDYDAFVVKLNAAGSDLVYATFLGKGKDDWAEDLIVDDSGTAWVSGGTESSAFPTTPGAFDSTHNGEEDAFVVKLDTAGSSLVYGTFVGGTGYEESFGIDVGADGAAYVTGVTDSSDFPATPGAFDSSYNGSLDGFALKLSVDGAVMEYATFLGESGLEWACGVAVDDCGAAHITGATDSPGFPTTAGAYDTTHNGLDDVWMAKLNAEGSDLAYATFLGGDHDEWGRAIRTQGCTIVQMTGYSESAGFPTTPGAYDTSHNGAYDVFIVELQTGAAPDFSVYLPLVVLNHAAP